MAPNNNMSTSNNIRDVMNQSRPDELWKKYEDAIFEITRLKEELFSKDAQIKSMTETIVQMSMELATAKAKEDDLGMQLRRRTSVVDATIIEKAITEEKRDRRKSVAATKRKSWPVDHRRKSESCALQSEESEDEDLDGSYKQPAERPLRLPSFRLGWGLDDELNEVLKEVACTDSTQDEKKHEDSPPLRLLGSFVRQFSLRASVQAPPVLPVKSQEKFDQDEEKSNEDAVKARRPKERPCDVGGENNEDIVRRPRARPVDFTGLKSSALIFPVSSSELLTAFTEKRGQVDKVEQQIVNAE
jgi:hypothetical protein